MTRWPKARIIDCLVAVWKSLRRPDRLLKCKYANISAAEFIQVIVEPASLDDISDPLFLYMAVFATILLTDMLQQSSKGKAIKTRLHAIEEKISQNVAFREFRRQAHHRRMAQAVDDTSTANVNVIARPGRHAESSEQSRLYANFVPRTSAVTTGNKRKRNYDDGDHAF